MWLRWSAEAVPLNVGSLRISGSRNQLYGCGYAMRISTNWDLSKARPGAKSEESAALAKALERIRLLEQEAELMRRAFAYLPRGFLPK